MASPPLHFGLIICTPPHTDEMSYLALEFAKHVILSGHKVERVFFYQDGVLHANQSLAPATDEPHLNEAWRVFSKQQNIILEVCSGASLRRGILDETEAKLRQKHSNLSADFLVSGVGQIAEICLTCDRVVQFK